jgi:hypothetical protein
MIRQGMIAACAIALAACGQGLPGATPPANPPSVQTPPAGQVQQAQIDGAQRAQLETLVRGLLDQTQQAYAADFRPAAGFNDEVEGIQPGHDHRWQVNLVGGTAYRIIGACDAECSNVDIELIDGNGSVAASDMLPDDVPVVSFTPPANARYTVRILMQTCTVAPCFAGARVLTQ